MRTSHSVVSSETIGPSEFKVGSSKKVATGAADLCSVAKLSSARVSIELGQGSRAEEDE